MGTGVNRKTAATPQHKASPSRRTHKLHAPGSAVRAAIPRTLPQLHPRSQSDGHSSQRAATGNDKSAGRRVMSQSEMNTATGHAASYKPKGYHAATSGFPTQGVRRAGSSHDAFKSGWQSNKPTGGAKLMKGLTTVGGFSDRGLVQGPGIPVRLLPSRARKGSIPQG